MIDDKYSEEHNNIYDKYLEHNIVSPLFSMAMEMAGVKIPFSAQNQSILVDSIKIWKKFC